MKGRYFTTFDIALISLFSALWAALNLTIGPLGYALFNLPILCDFAVFFTLLLVVWATEKFGSASIVGIMGATLALYIRATTHIIGFAISAMLLDILMCLIKHKLNANARNMALAALVTIVSAHFAGVVIGVLFMGKPWEYALTFWGLWHAMGGVVSVAVTLPIIAVLEKVNVKEMKQ